MCRLCILNDTIPITYIRLCYSVSAIGTSLTCCFECVLKQIWLLRAAKWWHEQNPLFFSIINHAVVSIIREKEQNTTQMQCDVMWCDVVVCSTRKDRDWQRNFVFFVKVTERVKKREKIVHVQCNQYKWMRRGGSKTRVGIFFTSHTNFNQAKRWNSNCLHIGLKIGVWITCIIDAATEYAVSV